MQIRETIIELQREANITTVFVTHDQEEALSMSDLIGVMNKGKVEQLGTPQQIYATPRTGYVADFVGAANRTEVAVRSASAGFVEVDVAGSRVIATDALEGPADRGLLVLRPEDLKISAAPVAGLQSLPATVRGRQYLGARTSYSVECAGDLVLNAEMHGAGHDAFLPGASIHLGFDPAQARVIRA
ncbi:Spermidine/putrescine import ATP-binding protein PotA [compost metagenome]